MNRIESIDLISRNPTIRRGKPCLAGVSLQNTDLVIAHLFHKRSLDELASDYQIDLAHVYASLAYYYQHKSKLEEDIRVQILNARKAMDDLTGVQPSLLS